VDANDTTIEGYVAPPEGPFSNVDYYQTVTADYVETMGIPVVEGRAFNSSDAGATTVLINETMARTFYKGQSPIGRRVKPSGGPGNKIPFFTIVGVLKDVKQGGVDRKTGTELYFNFEQVTTAVPEFGIDSLNIVMRTTQPPDALAATIHQAVARLDPSLPVEKLRSMDDVFGEAIGRPRLLAQLLGIFAGLALLLAAIGSYGVLSYMVTERRREIGIRMALGAGRSSVMRMVLSQGLRLTLVGVVVGLAGSFAMNRVLASLLFGVRPSDPLTIAAVVAIISGVALVACYLPARVATRVDPMIVLRDE
jgi:putative ABC transport system permease protein